MAGARIRTENPARVPSDLPFDVQEVQQLDEDEFPDPEDPNVLMVTGPRDLQTLRDEIQTQRRGERLVIRVSDPALLREEEFAAIVDEAGDDLVAIDLTE